MRRLLPWLILLLSALAVVVTAPPPTSDLGQFLPRADSRSASLLLDELRDGAASRLLLFEVSGGSAAERSEASRQLASSLRNSGHFTLVENGDRPLDEERERRLFRYRYLLNDTPFDRDSLRRALQQRLDELSAPLGMPDKGRLAADPTASYRSLLLQWRGEATLQHQNGVWFSHDGERALLLAQSRYPGFDLNRQQQLLTSVEVAFAQGQPERLTLAVTGAPRFAVESRSLIRGEATRLSIVASLLVMGLLWLAYRSLRVVLFAALPLAAAALTATAVVVLLFGQIHGITLAFGITLLGLAVDYPIHLFSHARNGGRPAEAITAIWPTLRLGVATTLLGFTALLLSGYGGLSQLGSFAVAGITTAALLTRTLLPILVPSLPARPLPVVQLTPRRHLALLPLLIGLSALPLLYSQRAALWEHDLARLNPIGEEAKQLDRQLRRELGATSSQQLLTIHGDDPQAMLRRIERLHPALQRLTRSGAIERFDSPAMLLPSIDEQRRRQAALPRPETLRKALAEAGADLPFRQGLFSPFIDGVAESRRLEPLTPIDLTGTPPGERLTTLMRPRGSSWLGVVSLHGITDPATVASAFKNEKGVDYLDTAQEASRLVFHYRNEALLLTAIGALVALLLLARMLPLRRLWRVVTPVAAAVITTVTSLQLMGESLSLFHIAALLLVIGIGLDYALFVERTPGSEPEFGATLHALLTCNLTTLLVFGLLASSTIPILHSIGQTVMVGALLSLLFALSMVHNGARYREQQIG